MSRADHHHHHHRQLSAAANHQHHPQQQQHQQAQQQQQHQHRLQQSDYLLHHNGLLAKRQTSVAPLGGRPSALAQFGHTLESLFISQQQQLQTNPTNQMLPMDQHQYSSIVEQQGPCQAGDSIFSYNCSSTAAANLDEMAFDSEEFTFSEMARERLWIRKDGLDILIRVAFVAPIVLLGIVGNLTIIYSMCKFKPFRSKPTNIFILNMAIADLLTSLVSPTVALFKDIYQFYVLGSFICRFEGFVKNWLLCVVQPCRTRISINQSWLALSAIWICSVLMASPLFVWRRLRQRQWKDALEVWCCELIQYTKYYWIGITFFLIYLPTFFMTVVLVIILVQMDKFEAKLRRSCATQSNGSLTINMKYRRRIVKILFTYLLTSIICWTPLQFTIIYRHFRSEAIPSPWFFELAFFSQLSASLTAAMDPIIFGFLSQSFRRVVTKSLMFKFIDKIMTTNARNSAENRNPIVHAINHHNHRVDHQHNNKLNNCRQSIQMETFRIDEG